ncbi:hypothetical protein [Mangrovibacillus cuniculi]|uniref:Uncharacterized protein n=1 Tax=Mangrovibacillus cuniculi TaxID=2593652 RepID=A0A7S8HGJ9_9BACI|nr:hypothetical protein [Mangrovibacillus cuniculi]QPC47631.1 hypothetical protein G8O30_12040 [Mangrovibacillus cuniculi]
MAIFPQGSCTPNFNGDGTPYWIYPNVKVLKQNEDFVPEDFSACLVVNGDNCGNGCTFVEGPGTLQVIGGAFSFTDPVLPGSCETTVTLKVDYQLTVGNDIECIFNFSRCFTETICCQLSCCDRERYTFTPSPNSIDVNVVFVRELPECPEATVLRIELVDPNLPQGTVTYIDCCDVTVPAVLVP